MGCYGDKLWVTPNVDALTAKALLYTKCWSNAPAPDPRYKEYIPRILEELHGRFP